MVIRPGHAELKVVFGPGVREQFRDQLMQAWESLDPVLYEDIQQAVEDTRSVAHMLIVYDSDANLFDNYPDLMNGFDMVQPVKITDEPKAMESITSMLTVAMLQQLVGTEHIMLHAAVIGDDETKRALALVGASGAGKTTATRVLGQKFAYLSDETTIAHEQTRAVVPYPKPLSVIEKATAPKRQLSPVSLGLHAVAPMDTSYALERIVLLDRREDATEAHLEPVPLDRALMTVAQQSSGMAFSRRGLGALADLLLACGGAWRLVYSEAEQLEPLITDLLGNGSALPAREPESYRSFTPIPALPNVFPNGTQTVARMPGTGGYRIGGDDGPFLLYRGQAIDTLSEFAARCWIEAEYETSREAHFARMSELFEGLPQDAYEQIIEQLFGAEILLLRTIDDPLYVDEPEANTL